MAAFQLGRSIGPSGASPLNQPPEIALAEWQTLRSAGAFISAVQVGPLDGIGAMSFLDRPIVPVVLVGTLFATGLIAACLIAYVR